MIPRIVDGLHYHLPFYREVKEERADAEALLYYFEERAALSNQSIRSTSIEPMADSWAVTINLEAAE